MGTLSPGGFTLVRKAFRQLGLVLACCCAAALAAAQDRQLLIAPVNPAPAGERRIALVIGNSSYKTSPLRNPVKDARAMAKGLAATGFKVTVVEDASETAMRRAIRAFGDELLAGGVGLFYYAGHGMQVRGRNYLIPVNADIEREDEVEDQAVDANLVLGKMDSAKNSLNLMILDACRNNPFARAFRSSARGLAQMDAPSGTLVAFATAPGSVASDGDGDNGLYTKHLLANMTRPGLPIEQVFKEVRIGVGRDTGDRQVPWESSSLRGNFFFIAPDPSLSEEARKRELERAVAEAVRGEQEKLAAQQREMQAMIREMLAKQRAELEEEMRRRDEALGRKPPAAVLATAPITAPTPQPPTAAPTPQPPAAAPAPEPPAQLASIAPTPVADPHDARLPRKGDLWQYVYTERATRRRYDMEVEVVGVSSDGILDADNFTGQSTLAHGMDAELIISQQVWFFSPYLHVLDAAKPGRRWNDIKARHDGFCSREPSCEYNARVIGRERVATPAGRFDALKVEVELTVSSPRLYTRRIGTFWYAESAKRMVKSSVRTLAGNPGAPDYDFELVSYKLN
jgi:uncharacterized caspase-like protein